MGKPRPVARQVHGATSKIRLEAEASGLGVARLHVQTHAVCEVNEIDCEFAFRPTLGDHTRLAKPGIAELQIFPGCRYDIEETRTALAKCRDEGRPATIGRSGAMEHQVHFLLTEEATNDFPGAGGCNLGQDFLVLLERSFRTAPGLAGANALCHIIGDFVGRFAGRGISFGTLVGESDRDGLAQFSRREALAEG